MTVLYRDFNFTKRSVDNERRSVRVVASTDAVDAYGEILVQDWDLTRYLQNPVVLWGHDASQPPIGHGSDVAVEEGKLAATLTFVDAKASPKAEEIWQGIQQGSIRGISVGFRSKKAESRDIDGRTVFVLTGNELIEISVVTIGANPEALIERARSMRAIRELAGARSVQRTSVPAFDLAARVRELEEELSTLRAPPPATERERALEEQLRTAREDAITRDRGQLLERGRQKCNVWPGIEAWCKTLSVEQLRFYVETFPGHPVLSLKTELEPRHSDGALTWNGKTYDQLSFEEKHALSDEVPELYRLMKEDAA